MIRLLSGDCRTILPTLPDASVQCVVTSPPYFGLRDYQTGTWEGGDKDCDHVAKQPKRGNATYTNGQGRSCASNLQAWGDRDVSTVYRDTCGKCGARRIDAQIGLEATPEAFIAELVAVFREVRRVLRDDGTVWLNMGDSYSSGARTTQCDPTESILGKVTARPDAADGGARRAPAGIAKAKDLLMMPARVALALQADGWWVRSEIVWCKKNPMPESAKDRPTSATEKVFLLAKSARYYYDNIALSETEANETLHDLPDRTARDQFPQGQARQQRTNPDMPRMCHEADGRMAIDTGGQREIPFGECAAQRETGAQGQNSGIQSLGEAQEDERGVASGRERQGVTGGLSAISETEGRSQAVLREREGQSADIAVSGDREGQGVISAGCPQASWPDADHEHAYGAGMARDQGQCGPQVPLLPQEDGPADDGSCDPSKPRGTPHSVEHRPGVPKLQFEQGQPHNQPALRNSRNWWLIATAPYKNAHFATFPPELAERCIRAGTSERGCCAACGAPWVRMTERSIVPLQATNNPVIRDEGVRPMMPRCNVETNTTGWSPSCQCNAETQPCVVLDPFSGAGTALLVADRLGRDAIGVDLSHAYVEMARERLRADCPLFADISPPPAREDAYDRDMRDLFEMAAD